MKDYLLKVRRRVSETMLFIVRAESLVQANRIGEADVRANKHPGRSKEIDVSVLECRGEEGE